MKVNCVRVIEVRETTVRGIAEHCGCEMSFPRRRNNSASPYEHSCRAAGSSGSTSTRAKRRALAGVFDLRCFRPLAPNAPSDTVDLLTATDAQIRDFEIVLAALAPRAA